MEHSRLTRAEDDAMRVLYWQECFGAELAPTRRQLLADLRQRDLRSRVRDPRDAVEPYETTG
jgi:hypothetical protein